MWETTLADLDDRAVVEREAKVYGRIGGDVVATWLGTAGDSDPKSGTVPVASFTRTSVGRSEHGPEIEVRFHGEQGTLAIPINGPDTFDFAKRLADDAGVTLLASRPAGPVLTDEARVGQAALDAAQTLNQKGIPTETFRLGEQVEARGWRAFTWTTTRSEPEGNYSGSTTVTRVHEAVLLTDGRLRQLNHVRVQAGTTRARKGLTWRTVPDHKYVEMASGTVFPSAGLTAESALEKLQELTAA